MSKYITIFLVFALFALTNAAQGRRGVNVNTRQENNIKWWTEGTATIYTSKSFDANVGKDKFVVIQFCATFSKECEALAPEYEKFAQMYSGASPKRSDVIVSKIDGWTFNSLSQTYSVKRFPTIRFFNKNDPTNSDEYSGDLTADKINEWVEGLIKTKGGAAAPATATEEKKPAEEKKPEEPKKEAEPVKEEVKTETKQAEPAKTETPAQTNTNQDQAKTADGEDARKEFKLVLNTTLLQAQFDEVQKQMNTLKDNLEKNIAENFKKVETLTQTLEGHKTDLRTLIDNLRGHGDKINQITSNLNSHKEDIKSSVTTHADNYFNQIKEGVNSIKSKVWEKKVDEPQGSGFLGNLIWMAIGGAIGAGIVFLVGAGGSKKRRSMLD